MCRDLVRETVDRLSELAIQKGEYAYYPQGSFEPHASVDKNAEVPLARIHRGRRLVSILKWPEGAPLNLG